MTNKPSIGRIVHYKLSQQDADNITARRNHPTALVIGNHVKAGDVFPMLITRVWGDTPESAVQGQVLLDGNDVLWATSVSEGDGERQYTWPSR